MLWSSCCLLSEKELAGVRTVDARMATGAVAIARIGQIVIGGRLLNAASELWSERAEIALPVMALQAQRENHRAAQ